MKKEATLKYEEGWVYNMFQNKLEKYGYHTMQYTFEVAKETEKAVQLIVDTNNLIGRYGGEYYGPKHEWLVWMPKSAMIAIEEVA